MPITGVPIITAPGIPVDMSRPLPVRDPFLAGVQNAGVRFMADLAFPFCFPGGPQANRPAAGNPALGAVIQDMTDRENGSFEGAGGGTIFAGNGFDFTATTLATNQPVGVSVPASVLADIWTPYKDKSQRFMIMLYIKLAALADWNTDAAVSAIIGDKADATAGVPSLLNLSQQMGGYLDMRRQIGSGAVQSGNFRLLPVAADYGTVVQLAYWRNDAGQALRLRSANGTILTTRALDADNAQDFSGNKLIFGHPTSYNGGIPSASSPGPSKTLKNVRIYRLAIENLARSGRDPAAVLDADWVRQQARGLFG